MKCMEESNRKGQLRKTKKTKRQKKKKKKDVLGLGKAIRKKI